MSENRFSLTWDVHKNNISDGLSSFQQNGDFVDMTLAADGHYVKVHQVMLAVASPYLKQIISELNCPHPVIFLNRISYETLSSLLEYIYTGEVLVALEHLNDIVEAAKELHIRGLENMTVKILSNNGETKDMNDDDEKADEQEQICFVEMKSEENSLDVSLDQGDEDQVSQQELPIEAAAESESQPAAHKPAARKKKFVPSIIAKSKEMHSKILKSNVMQYTISNQGSLQMILNRYIYYLKHINRDNSKQWRCVDYVNKLKCPAIVFTKDDLVTQRISAHTHPFHDRRIFKKAQANAIFSAINEAVLSDKNKNSQNISDEEA